MQFDPTSIRTQFTHVFILIKSEMVQNENDISVPGYRVTVTSSVDVPKFGPPLPNPPVFTDFSTLQKFLLAKRKCIFTSFKHIYLVINAENAALKSPKFSKPNDRARHAIYDSIIEEFSEAVTKEDKTIDSAEKPIRTRLRIFSTGSSQIPPKKYKGSSSKLSEASSIAIASGALPRTYNHSTIPCLTEPPKSPIPGSTSTSNGIIS